MKWIAIVLFLAVVSAQRQGRDIGLHLSGGHHHDDHHHEAKDAGQVSASASVSVETKAGYGRDIPTPPLSINLAPEVKAEPAKEAAKGYPRENPANPLKLDPQAANKVEVRVDGSTTAAPMMGGEIPGNAGTDYPIFDKVPETSFNCKDQAFGGYYADVDEGRCQVFHVCHDGRKFSFLCPNGTIFDQKVFVCNWWFNVDCAASKDFYELNSQIGVVPEKPAGSAANENGAGPLTAASIIDTQQVASPNLEYLPPKEAPKEPETSYLPPQAEQSKLDTSYLPPKVAPNAVEALSNGIIAKTTANNNNY